MYQLLPKLVGCCCLLILLLSGCSWLEPAKKPDTGPAGQPEVKSNPPMTQRFKSPLKQFYQLDETAGVMFEAIQSNNWQQAQAELLKLQSTWQQIQPQIGDLDNADEATTKLTALADAVKQQDNTNAQKQLNGAMSSISDICLNYKLSPLSDLILLGNYLRNVSFAVMLTDWPDATTKVTELDRFWGQIKPSIENPGILNEVTRSHAYIKQLTDAVEAKNQESAQSHIKHLNRTLGAIREHLSHK